VRSMYTFVARYSSHTSYFYYCGAGKLLLRITNHVRGCWAKGVLPRGCSRVIPDYCKADHAKFQLSYLRPTPHPIPASLPLMMLDTSYRPNRGAMQIYADIRKPFLPLPGASRIRFKAAYKDYFFAYLLSS
jgi:hypothetical protein